MGVVYLGRSAGGRTVAVKLVRRQFAADEEFRARFRREVQAVRAVSGVFTAAVVDADTEAAPPWLATAFIPGVPLGTAVRRHGPLPEPVLRALATGLAEALVDIHRAGIVHRDLKPANVMLAADGPHVIDFGISRAAESTSLTSTGIIVGSPGFLSPEQVTGADVGPATDVFALGATLAFAALGTGPFGDGPTPALLYRVATQDPDLSGLPSALQSVIRSCLAKDPAQRPTPAQLIVLLGRGPAFDLGGGWLPQPVLADIAAAAAVLTGVPLPDGDATLSSAAQPLSSAAQPLSPPAQPLSSPASAEVSGGVGPAAPPPRPGLSRRALLGLVGGGVVAVGGVATAVALSGGGGTTMPGAGPRPSGTPAGGGSTVSGPSGTAPGPSGTAPGAVPQPVASGLTGTLAAPTATPVWTAALDDTVRNMTVGGGTLVIVGPQSVKGLDPATGGARWHGVADVRGPIGSLLLVAGGTGYLTGYLTGGTGLLAVDAATGTTSWSVGDPNRRWLLGGVAGVVGTTVYVTGNPLLGDIYTSGLWAVDVNSHQTVWSVTGTYLGSIIVPPDGPYLFGMTSHSLDGSLSAINMGNGQRVWSQSIKGVVGGDPSTITGCYTEGKLFVGGDQLHAFNPSDGSPAWPPVRFDPSDRYNRPITDSAGRVFVTSGGTLYAVRAGDGAMLWKTTGVNYFRVGGSLATADGMVYAVDGKGVVFAVDAVTGSCRWSYSNSAVASSSDVSVAASGGLLYYGVGREVTAFKAR